MNAAVLRWRIGIAAWFMGGDFNRTLLALWIIRERELHAITPDGHVVLANCAPLAEVLYAKVPGKWAMSMTYVGDDS